MFYRRLKQSKNVLTSIKRRRALEVEISDASGGLNKRDEDINVANNELTGGENTIITAKGKLDKAKGATLYGNLIGTTTGILGGFNFINRTGSQEQLVVYDTGVYRYVAGLWTALNSVTMTINKDADGAYFPLTDKFYIVNKTDNAVKVTNGSSSGDQSDSSFKKGKFIEHFKNRMLVANVTNQEDYVWYTDLGVDTFSTNNYFRVEGTITGMKVLYELVLIFGKQKINRLENFVFDGVVAGPEAVFPLPTQFGAIYDRTIVVANNFIYFLGQDLDNKCHLYKTDGYVVQIVSDKISPILDNLAAGQLQYACAGFDGKNYRLSVAESGQTTNNIEIIYEVDLDRFHPIRRKFEEGVASYACYFTSETNGQWDLYAGTQVMGQVYKLEQQDYEELAEEKYITLGTYNVPIDSNPAKRGAQSFKLSNYNSNQTISISELYLRLKKNAGTATELTVRIETDNNGKPSGTLVDTDATTTITAFTSTDYAWKKADFSGTVTLNGNTTYWIVVKHTTEGSGSSQYYWSGDTCTAGYANGNLAVYTTAVASSTDTFNPSISAIDGTVGSLLNDVSWDTVHDNTIGNGTNDFSSVNLVYINSGNNTNLWRDIQRGIFQFDTSPIPNDATIISAILSIYVTDFEDQFGDMAIGITKSTPASATEIDDPDYNVTNFDSVRYADDINLVDLTKNAYNNFTLNASGRAAISSTGITKLGLRTSYDIDDYVNTFKTLSFSGVWYQSSRGVNKPCLTITYTTVTGVATWTSDATTDQNFIIYAQSAIDAWADFKSLMLAGLGGRIKLQKFMSLFSTIGDYNMEVGFSMGEIDSYINYLVSLSGNSSPVWGSFVWRDGSVWGGAVAKNYTWQSVSNLRGRAVKVRVRNRSANQPFTFNGIKFIYNTIKKYR